MNASATFLAASLALNGMLVIGLLSRNETPDQSDAGRAPVGAKIVADESKVTALSRAMEDWTRYQSIHPRELGKHLEAAGVPPLERAIIEKAAIQLYYGRRAAEIVGQTATFDDENWPYWKTPSAPVHDREKMTALSVLGNETALWHREVDRRIFVHDPAAIALARRRFGDLSLDKLAAIQHADIDRDIRMLEISAKAVTRVGVDQTPEEKTAYAAAEETVIETAKATLTPAEFEQFQLHHGPRASAMRQQLQAFQPSKEEFMAIHALYRDVDEELGVSSSPEPTANRREAEQKIEQQIAQLLGEDRFADYQQALRGGGDQLNRLMVRLNLPLRTAATLTAIRDSATARAHAIRDDARLSAPQRAQALAALADEASNNLAAMLGNEGFEAYDDLKGEWLRTLRRNSGSP